LPTVAAHPLPVSGTAAMPPGARGEPEDDDGGEPTRVRSRVDRDPPPLFTEPTDDYMYRHFRRDLLIWQANTTIEEKKIGGVVLRNLRGQARLACEEIVDEALTGESAVELILQALDNAFQYLKEEEAPAALEKALYTCVRDPKKERFTTFVNRRRLEFIALERLRVVLPDTLKGYTTLRFARLDERSYDKVISWTDGTYNFEKIAKALIRLGQTAEQDYHDRIQDPYYLNSEWLDGAIEEPWVLLDVRPAMSYPVEYKQVRNQLNEARKARGFFKPKCNGKTGKGDKGKSKGKGKSPQRRRISIDQLKLRAKCAKCKQVGHWARECPQNRQQRPALGAFTMHNAAGGANQQFNIDEPTSYTPSAGSAVRFFIGMISMFIGLAINAWEFLVDTGAQEGIIGIEQLKGLAIKLKEFGLQPRWVPDEGPAPRGIEGDAKVVGRVEVPVGIAGMNGIVSFRVLDEEVPALLLVGLTRAMEMDLKLRGSGDQAFFHKFGAGTKLRTIGQNGHTAISIIEFAPGGWCEP
ncbi:unnamed protein product, partial [Prorocentrum cordatum]